MLKILQRTNNKWHIHITTPSPNHYPNFKTITEIKPKDKYKGSAVFFDDILGTRNSSQKDELFSRGRHEDLDVYYIKQSFFDLPRQSIRNNSARMISFQQTLGVVESMYKGIGGYDMKYDGFKKRCRKTWSENFNNLCIVMARNKKKVSNVFSMKAETHVLTVHPRWCLFKTQ